MDILQNHFDRQSINDDVFDSHAGMNAHRSNSALLQAFRPPNNNCRSLALMIDEWLREFDRVVLIFLNTASTYCANQLAEIHKKIMVLNKKIGLVLQAC